jgi:hypothetical protein
MDIFTPVLYNIKVILPPSPEANMITKETLTDFAENHATPPLS